VAARRLGAAGWWRAALVAALIAATPQVVDAAEHEDFALAIGFRLPLGAGAAPTFRLRLERTRPDLTRRHELAALELAPGAGIQLRLADRVSWDIGAHAFVAGRH